MYASTVTQDNCPQRGGCCRNNKTRWLAPSGRTEILHSIAETGDVDPAELDVSDDIEIVPEENVGFE